MANRKYTEEQIVNILKEAQAANKYIIAPERPQEFLQILEGAMAAAKKTGGTQ
jgi:hypothetical protein